MFRWARHIRFAYKNKNDRLNSTSTVNPNPFQHYAINISVDKTKRREIYIMLYRVFQEVLFANIVVPHYSGTTRFLELLEV